jgi:hypothetical protein
MVLFNYATKELTAKIVYYGPGLCGKTTNLQFIHQNLPDTVKGKMLSLATKTDRTLFFDFLPLDLGEIRGMKTRVQLYTVPGQVFYNETRKLVLKGVDGVVFVADSQQDMLGPNVESFKNLEDNLKGHGLKLSELPHVIQFNKRDLPKLSDIEELNSAVNKYNAPFYESVATTGIGVKDTLNAITKLVLLHLTKKYGKGAPAVETKPEVESAPAEATPEPVSVAASAQAEESAAAGSDRAAPEAIPVSATAQVDAATSTPPPPSAGQAALTGDPAAAVTVGSSDELPEGAPPARFGDDEIDDLMGEVASTGTETPASSEPPAADAELEAPLAADIDAKPTARAPVEEVPPETPQDEPTAAPETEVTLTEAASDDDLFRDPDLEVARIEVGQAQEIVVPVEVGGERGEVRRFKLSLRLRLESVD